MMNIIRFIPAGAGNSAGWLCWSSPRPVYPRWRGELMCTPCRNRPSLGLSPLARGTRMIRADEELSDRFIPAGAGNSIQNWLLLGYTPVYPRWRGELACCLHIPQCARRFIPAGAGNSFMPLIKKVCNSVYPRWRGELHKKTNRNWLVFGLSPLARGTPLQTQFLTSPARFIPAGAGNSFFQDSCQRIFTVYPRWRGELSKHNLLLINNFLSQSQSTNFIVSHKQHIHYVKEHLIH